MNQQTCTVQRAFRPEHCDGLVDSKAARNIFIGVPRPAKVGGKAWMAFLTGRKKEQHTLGLRAQHLLRGSCSGRRISRTVELN